MDTWARWLLHDRFGGDESALASMLAKLLPIRDRILDRAQVREGDTVLDVGAGDGLVGFGALDRVGATGKIIFSDVSAGLLSTCERLAGEAGVGDRCRFVEASAEKLDGVEDGTVDVVTTRSVLIYVHDKPGAFREFFRVLGPGGRVSVYEPINRTMRSLNRDALFGYDARPIRELARKVASVFEQAHPAESSPMMNFDADDLVAAAREAGFVRLDAEVRITEESDPYVGAADWATLEEMRPNPLVPTAGEAIEQALTPGERSRLKEYLEPLVNAGQGRWFMVSCFLAGHVPDDA